MTKKDRVITHIQKAKLHLSQAEDLLKQLNQPPNGQFDYVTDSRLGDVAATLHVNAERVYNIVFQN